MIVEITSQQGAVCRFSLSNEPEAVPSTWTDVYFRQHNINIKNTSMK